MEWPAPAGSPTVFIAPGLGFPRYLLGFALALHRSGSRVVLVDQLAWRGPRPRVRPTMEGLGAAGAQVVRLLGSASPAMTDSGTDPAPVIVFGHSTGAQVALEAVLRLPPTRPPLRLVMAGPTFQPSHRRLGRMALAALTAYREDNPRELAVLRDLAKVRLDIVQLVDSARRHRPEDRVGGLRVPLTLTAGTNDSFAPLPWLQTLAAASGSGGRVVRVPGSHNNPFTHPDEVAAVVLGTDTGG